MKPYIGQRVDITYKSITKQYQVIYLQESSDIVQKFIIIDNNLSPTLVLLHDTKWWAKFNNVNLEEGQEFQFY